MKFKVYKILREKFSKLSINPDVSHGTSVLIKLSNYIESTFVYLK